MAQTPDAEVHAADRPCTGVGSDPDFPIVEPLTLSTSADMVRAGTLAPPTNQTVPRPSVVAARGSRGFGSVPGAPQPPDVMAPPPDAAVRGLRPAAPPPYTMRRPSQTAAPEKR